MKLEFFFYQLLLLVIYFNNVTLVPDDYCLSPLNRSDCGTPPTPVFSYYKYGSRCEIDYWRGCPTKNMFENEYHCSHHCIGRLRFDGRERGCVMKMKKVRIQLAGFKSALGPDQGQITCNWRGSWEERDRTSNDDLKALSDLEDENGFLRNINDSVTDVKTDAPLEEIFTNHSPTPRVRDSTITVEIHSTTTKKDDNDKTTTDNVENTEDNSNKTISDNEDVDDEDDNVPLEPVLMTQMPLVGKPNTTNIFVRRRGF